MLNMYKSIGKSLLLLAMLIVSNCNVSAQERFVEVDGLTYKINCDDYGKELNTVEVSRESVMDTYSGAITVPEKVIIDNKEYTVVSVHGWTFKSQKITSILLPNTVKELGHSCFLYCDSLQSVTLSQSLEAIPDLCFCGCNTLKSLTIPASVKNIGLGCFQFCQELRKVVCLALEPPIIDTKLEDMDSIGPIKWKPHFKVYVPRESVGKYKTADVWKVYEILPIEDSISSK